jgi:major membrane immunogen (membrane-anchored lipoprotein)
MKLVLSSLALVLVAGCAHSEDVKAPVAEHTYFATYTACQGTTCTQASTHCQGAQCKQDQDTFANNAKSDSIKTIECTDGKCVQCTITPSNSECTDYSLPLVAVK